MLWGQPWGQPWGLVRTRRHVMTSGSDGTGDGSLGNPWRTIGFGISQLPAGSVAEFDSSKEELWVWYDPDTPYLGPIAAAVSQGIRVFGVDSAGVAAYQPGWNPAEKVLVDCTGTNATGWTLYHDQHIQGFEMFGTPAHGKPGITGQSGDRRMRVEDFLIRDFGSSGMRAVDTSIIDRVTVLRCNNDTPVSAAIVTAAAGTVIRACLVVDCGLHGIMHFGATGLIEACTVIRSGEFTVPNGTGFDVRFGGPTLRNCVAVDNFGTWGIWAGVTSLLEGCCSFSSSPATYHTISNYANPPGGDNTETDPGLRLPFRGRCRHGVRGRWRSVW